jgi:hypothetical protein
LKYVDWLLLQHKYRVWLCQSLVCALLVSRLLWAYLTANMGTSGTRSVLNQTCISIVDQIVMLVLNGLIHAMPFMSSTDFCRPVLNRGSWLSIQAFRFRVNDWVSIITVTPPSSQYTVTPTESIGKWDDDEFDDKEEGKYFCCSMSCKRMFEMLPPKGLVLVNYNVVPTVWLNF